MANGRRREALQNDGCGCRCARGMLGGGFYKGELSKFINDETAYLFGMTTQSITSSRRNGAIKIREGDRRIFE
jgi:hypothetical protein